MQKGSEDGNGSNWNETTLQAGNILNISSGRDTVLAGTQASGQTIIGDIGRDLTLTSLQDEDHYRSRQTQGSLGGSFTFGSMSGSASFSISKQKLDSDFNKEMPK